MYYCCWCCLSLAHIRYFISFSSSFPFSFLSLNRHRVWMSYSSQHSPCLSPSLSHHLFSNLRAALFEPPTPSTACLFCPVCTFYYAKLSVVSSSRSKKEDGERREMEWCCFNTQQSDCREEHSEGGSHVIRCASLTDFRL